MGKPQRHVGVLLGQQERIAFVFVQGFHNAEDLFHQLWRQPHGRLVQKDRFRTAHQRAANRDHLLFPARRIARLGSAALLETRKIGIDHFQIPVDIRRGTAACICAGQKIFFDGEVLKAMPPFHHLDHTGLDHIGRITPLGALAPVGDAALGHFAPLRMQQVGDGLERGGLARAIAAQQRGDTPLGNAQAHAFQDEDHVIVDHLDIVDLQNGLFGATSVKHVHSLSCRVYRCPGRCTGRDRVSNA